MLESGSHVLAVRPLRAAEIPDSEQQTDERTHEQHVDEERPLIRHMAANEDQCRHAPKRMEFPGGPNHARRGDREIGQGSQTPRESGYRQRGRPNPRLLPRVTLPEAKAAQAGGGGRDHRAR